MPEPTLPLIPVSELRVGHYVLLDLGWMAHPFARNHFRITSQQQIESIRKLGLSRVRIDPARSEFDSNDNDTPAPAAAPAPDTPAAAANEPGAEAARARERALDEQRRSLGQCERQYQEGARYYRAMLEAVEHNPAAASEQARAYVDTLLSLVDGQGDLAIRLLGDVQGDRGAQHAMNVTVLSLLLGRAIALEPPMLQALTLAAFLHDIGKMRLPDIVRYKDDAFTPAQLKAYQGHVAHSVALGRAMGLDATTLLAIGQHHEAADGSGFPSGCAGKSISTLSHVLILTNRYDGLCNPLNPASALTPHQALAQLFATQKARFDSTILSRFIRMLGIYPPGSIVQLSDGRYAQVHMVNAARPLKPRVLVHDPRTPRSEALLLDLETTPELSILRSLRADQLPRAALDYLEPRPRYCYFFQRAVSAGDSTARGST